MKFTKKLSSLFYIALLGISAELNTSYMARLRPTFNRLGVRTYSEQQPTSNWLTEAWAKQDTERTLKAEEKFPRFTAKTVEPTRLDKMLKSAQQIKNIPAGMYPRFPTLTPEQRIRFGLGAGALGIGAGVLGQKQPISQPLSPEIMNQIRLQQALQNARELEFQQMALAQQARENEAISQKLAEERANAEDFAFQQIMQARQDRQAELEAQKITPGFKDSKSSQGPFLTTSGLLSDAIRRPTTTRPYQYVAGKWAAFKNYLSSFFGRPVSNQDAKQIAGLVSQLTSEEQKKYEELKLQNMTLLQNMKNKMSTEPKRNYLEFLLKYTNGESTSAQDIQGAMATINTFILPDLINKIGEERAKAIVAEFMQITDNLRRLNMAIETDKQAGVTDMKKLLEAQQLQARFKIFDELL